MCEVGPSLLLHIKRTISSALEWKRAVSELSLLEGSYSAVDFNIYCVWTFL